MDLPEERGIEPDYCFYIDNWRAVTGKDRIDWQVEPLPDLAIEIDVTNFTAVDDYLPYQCPEVWLLRGNTLSIYHFKDNHYIPESVSRYFSDVDLAEMVSRVFKWAASQGTGSALQQLRRNLDN